MDLSLVLAVSWVYSFSSSFSWLLVLRLSTCVMVDPTAVICSDKVMSYLVSFHLETAGTVVGFVLTVVEFVSIALVSQIN